MDLDKIKKAINDESLSQESIELVIIEAIAKDERAFNLVLMALDIERKFIKDALRETNHELSRLTAFAAQPKRKMFGEGFSFEFIVGQIQNLYQKYFPTIGPMYNEQLNIFPKYNCNK